MDALLLHAEEAAGAPADTQLHPDAAVVHAGREPEHTLEVAIMVRSERSIGGEAAQGHAGGRAGLFLAGSKQLSKISASYANLSTSGRHLGEDLATTAGQHARRWCTHGRSGGR